MDMVYEPEGFQLFIINSLQFTLLEIFKINRIYGNIRYPPLLYYSNVFIS